MAASSLAARVYSQELQSQNLGEALWFPEPDGTDGQVEIGDVGFIWDGSFSKLFNITVPADHPSNRNGVPVGFIPLEFPRDTLVRSRARCLDDGPLCSRSIKQVSATAYLDTGAAAANTRAGVSFECSNDKGALLVLNDGGADQAVLKPNTLFPEYMLKHHDSWFEFARERQNDVEPEDIVVVRGTIKARRWTVAAFVDESAQQSLRFEAQGMALVTIGASLTLSTTYSTSVLHRSGPTFSTAGTETDAGSCMVVPKDQCVFLSRYTIRRRRLPWTPRTIRAQGFRKEDYGGRDNDDLDSTVDAEGKGIVRSESYPPLIVEDDFSHKRPINPLDILLKYILESSECEAAVASEEDIYMLGINGYDTTPKDFEIQLYSSRPPIDSSSISVACLSVPCPRYTGGSYGVQNFKHALEEEFLYPQSLEYRNKLIDTPIFKPESAGEKQKVILQRVDSTPLSYRPSVNGQHIKLTLPSTILRMPTHNRNTRLISQDQLCPKCPAKFTRVTHLQRHMRTHPDTREYKCENCGSEFTRTDLLTRHRRTCGDPSSAHRPRRRSCKACVDDNAKCNLKQPCSRCLSKQRNCVYEPRDPISPSISGMPTSASDDIKPHLPLLPPTAGPSNAKPYVPPDNSRSQPLDDPDLHLLESIEDIPGRFNAYRTYPGPSSSYAGSSDAESFYAESSIFPGDIPGFNTYPKIAQGNLVQGANTIHQTVNTLFSENLLQEYYYDVIDMQLIPGFSSSISMPTLPRRGGPVPWDMQPSIADVPSQTDDMFYGDALMGISTLMNEPPHSPPIPALVPHVQFPYPSEYQQYIHMFYNLFLAQMPVVHIPTFSVEGKPHVLISAIQACGALYARSPAAIKFIDDTLASAHDELVVEFSKNPVDPDMQFHLVLAMVLFQTIGLFHQTSGQRAQSSQFHTMLITTIRQSSLVQYITAWCPPTHSEVESGKHVWHQWAFHETVKRTLLLSYLHDTCHCIYFTLQPFYDAGEMTVPLPCENAIWKADTYQEWCKALSKDSSYGSLRERLQPMGLQTALAKLADQSSPESEPPITVTPFAHFILIHAVLRKFFTECVGSKVEEGVEGEGVVYNIQFMLHKWVKSWYHSPDTPKDEDAVDPALLHDALPFYWISQALLLAQRDNLLMFGQEGRNKHSGKAKYTLMKEWLRLVRENLRKEKGEGTFYWDQLWKIRMMSKQEKDGSF